MRRSCGRFPRSRAMSGASRFVSPRPTRVMAGIAAAPAIRPLISAKARLERRGARSVKTCVLIDKKLPRAAAITPDFTGFPCPPVFVVGYGMDLAHHYRELPFIGEVAAP